MFKKLIINILIVVIVVGILDFAIGRTLRYFYFKEASGLHYRSTYSIDSTTAEILIFGASRANHHYVPEIFEDSLKKTFYNSGRDGNGIFYEFALLKSILKRHTPKIIILENPGEFFKKKSEFENITSLLPYYRTHKEIQQTILSVNSLEKLKFISEIYPFNSQTFTIAMGNLEMNKKRVYDNKGYVPLSGVWQKEPDSIKNDYLYEKDNFKINIFKNFVDTVRDLGVQIFVVSSPIFQKYNFNPDIEVSKQICSAEKIPFLDFSKDTLFINNKNLFQDILHLNNNGAILFSKLVASKILQFERTKISGIKNN